MNIPVLCAMLVSVCVLVIVGIGLASLYFAGRKSERHGGETDVWVVWCGEAKGDAIVSIAHEADGLAVRDCSCREYRRSCRRSCAAQIENAEAAHLLPSS
jgi:hypothetical protein